MLAVPAPTSNQASHLQAAAAASTHCGEVQKEGQQSQQQSEEEMEEGEIIAVRKLMGGT